MCAPVNHHQNQDNESNHQLEHFFRLFCDSSLLPLPAMSASCYHRLVCILEFHVHGIIAAYVLFHVASFTWHKYIEFSHVAASSINSSCFLIAKQCSMIWMYFILLSFPLSRASGLFPVWGNYK